MDHGLITFYELIPNPRPPMRATKSAGGTLPDRHHRCEPVRVASGFGWYVFLPLDLYILFDGMEAKWSFDEEQWFALDSICYPDAQRYPPFLVMTEDHGILQIWTGLVVKTEPNWSVLVRQPANYFQPTGYQMLEGVIETDHWTGPLFTNVRLLRTGSRIFFPANRPFAQIQPVPREVQRPLPEHVSDEAAGGARLGRLQQDPERARQAVRVRGGGPAKVARRSAAGVAAATVTPGSTPPASPRRRGPSLPSPASSPRRS